jgi:hypothetical protein
MSFVEITGVFCGQHTKHINTLRDPQQNHLPNVTEGSRLSLGLDTKSPQKL